jgi:hypothetical protein
MQVWKVQLLKMPWVLDDSHAETPIYYTEVITGKLTAKDAMAKIRSSIGRK